MWDAVLRDAAVIEARSLEELLDVVVHLHGAGAPRMPAGNGVAIVTFGGGGGVLAADQCARQGLATPLLTQATRERLRPLVPPIAAIENPVDLTPQVYNNGDWFARFGEALDVIAADPGIAAILLQFGPMAQRAIGVARTICDFRRRTGKPVCLAWPLAPREVPEYLRAEGFTVFTESARAIVMLGKLARRHADAARPVVDAAPAIDFDWSAHVRNPTEGMIVAEPDCHRMLAAAGLDVAAGRLTDAEDAAAEAANTVGFPVAMKGISPAVTHRAAAGLLALGIRSADEARATYRSLTGRAAAARIVLDGIYVQHMIREGFEVLVSAFRDPLFGVMVSCGAGGNFTELIDDVTLERAPVGEDRALAMIERLRLAHSVRRMNAPPDARLLARYISRFSQIAAAAPWRQFVLELNPVKWGHDHVTAVDGLLIIEEP